MDSFRTLLTGPCYYQIQLRPIDVDVGVSTQICRVALFFMSENMRVGNIFPSAVFRLVRLKRHVKVH
jgi:hypothetical protein